MSDKKNIIDTFTELAPRYEETMDAELRYIWNTSYQDVIKLISSASPINNNDLVLDVATGTARIPLAHLDHHPEKYHTIGLDITPAMLRYGQKDIRQRQITNRIQLVCASGMEMPFADNSFNVISCGLGMHHMKVAQTVQDIQKKLKPEGTLVIVTIGAQKYWKKRLISYLLKIIAFIVFSIKDNPTRARSELEALSSIYTITEWYQILHTAGFSDVKIDVKLFGKFFWFPNGLLILAKK